MLQHKFPVLYTAKLGNNYYHLNILFLDEMVTLSVRQKLNWSLELNLINSKKELPCAICVFVYILKPGSCFLAFQFEELRCSSNQISCACLESVQSSVFYSFKINITSPSYYIK